MGDVTNPWSAEGWNLTAQSNYVKRYGLARAEARARDAGSRVGATKPPQIFSVDGIKGPFVPTPPAVWILRKEVVNLVPTAPSQLSTVGSVNIGVGVSLAAIMYRELDLPSATSSIGYNATVHVILEQDLQVANIALGFNLAAAITTSLSPIQPNFTIGISQATVLTRELQLAAAMALGLTEATTIAAPPTYIEAGTFTTSASNVTTLSPTLPVDRAVGDLLLVWFGFPATGETVTITGGGWTDIGSSISLPGNYFARVVDGTEAASITGTWATATSAMCQVYLIRNQKVGTVAAVLGAKNTALTSGSTTVVVPSVTTTGINSMVFGLMLKTSTAAPTLGTPSGFTGVEDHTGGNPSNVPCETKAIFSPNVPNGTVVGGVNLTGQTSTFYRVTLFEILAN